MRLSDFEYDLPEGRIAQQPANRRDSARLMVVDRASYSFRHCIFRDLPNLLDEEDLLVVNNSRVIPARLLGHRPGCTERIEVLLVRSLEEKLWQALTRPGRKSVVGTRLIFGSGVLQGRVEEILADGRRIIRFECTGPLREHLQNLGLTPLPPYIRRELAEERDRIRYQTVYARHEGSVAAPTAGLHLTRALLREINHCEITLHVGLGTFRPVTATAVEDHQMESEFYQISAEAASRICQTATGPGRVIAVGTTTTRALEHCFSVHRSVVADSGLADLFIYPGHRFRVIDGLITNFHLPRSTLLMLVAALTGREFILEAYREAIRKGYRFYSYGDAMLVL